MQKLEPSQLKSVFDELSGGFASYITQQSFIEGLSLNRVQIAKGIGSDSPNFVLYCVELFRMLLQQRDLYTMSSSNSTQTSGKIDKSVIASKLEEEDKCKPEFCGELRGSIDLRLVIAEEAF